MNIDIDAAARSNLPPWDLTITHGGRTYAVRQPSGEQIVKLLEMQKKPPLEAYRFLFDLFYDLTGADPKESGLTLDQVNRFMAGLGKYLGDRGRQMKIRSEQALVIKQAAAGVAFN